MALPRVSTTRGSTNGSRYFPRADVKDAASKLRRFDDRRASFEDFGWDDDPAVVVKNDTGKVVVKSPPVVFHSERDYVRGSRWGYGGMVGGELVA